VLVYFWTYTCINWLCQLPHVRAWAEKYSGHGLAVIGVHFLRTRKSSLLFGVGEDAAAVARSIAGHRSAGAHPATNRKRSPALLRTGAPAAMPGPGGPAGVL
jgi:hypothetical protein